MYVGQLEYSDNLCVVNSDLTCVLLCMNEILLALACYYLKYFIAGNLLSQRTTYVCRHVPKMSLNWQAI